MMARRKTAVLQISSLLLLLMIAATPLQTKISQTTHITGVQDSVSRFKREISPPTSTYWAKTYGGSVDEEPWSAQQTSDGGYIVAGSTDSFGSNRSDYWVLKLSSNGSVMWQKTYGSFGDDYAFSIQQTSDEGYIVAGYTNSFSGHGYDAWVLKLSSNGSINWQKFYGGARTTIARSVQQTADGGYIVAGYTNSYDVSYSHFWVMKLDSAGSVDWQKTYGGTRDDIAWSIQQTSDGGYIVAGWTDSFGGGHEDIWLLKLNSTGDVTWQKTYGGSGDDEPWSVQQTSDGYIVAGDTNSFGAGDWDAWVLKLDSAGSVDWQKTYGGSDYDYVCSLQQTSDGGYVAAGETFSSGAGSGDVWFLKLNSTGSVELQKAYGGSDEDFAYAVQETSDGGYMVAGYTRSFGAGNDDIWVLKFGIDGNIVWDPHSGASTHTTSVTPSDSNAKSSTTSVTAADGTATVRNTHINPQDTHARVKRQAPPDVTPPAAITDLSATTRTKTSVTLNWTASGNDGMSEDAAWYVVKYSETGEITGANWDSSTEFTQAWVPLPAGSNETHVVTHLASATRYWFAVVAYDDSFNYGDVSNSPNATTLEGFPPAAITDLAASNPTDTNITLTWTAPGDNGTLGTAAGYIVKYSTSGPIDASNWHSATSYNQTWAPAENGSAETHMVSGLAPGTTYWFAVEAYDEALNYGGVSNSPSGTTSNTIVTILIVGGAGGAVVVAIAVTLYLKKRPT